MDDQYRNVVMKDATEASISALDSLISRSMGVPLSARGLWWDALMSSLYAGMIVSLDGDQERAMRVLEHLRENAAENKDYIATQLQGKV